MRTITSRERRTIRIAAIGVAIYLAFFFGSKAWSRLESVRERDGELRLAAATLDTKLLRAAREARRYRDLREKWRFDPSTLERATLVSGAWEAIEKCATTHQLALGASREAQGRGSARQIRVFQVDGVGATQNAMEFLHDLRHLGVPLVVEQITVSTANLPPGQVRLTLTLPVYDYEAWKGGAKHA